MWNMEELFELRTYIEQGRYQNALTLLGEMEEMSQDDKINKITSYLEILLLHLIKQHVEKRTTKSWNASIRNSLIHIGRTNKRRKAGGWYLSQNEIREAIEDAYEPALIGASIEAFEGRCDTDELGRLSDEKQIKKEAEELIEKYY